MEDEKVTVRAIVDKGTYESVADYAIVQLMMRSKYVSILGKSILVQGIEVTDKGEVNFYGREVEVDKGTKRIIGF